VTAQGHSPWTKTREERGPLSGQNGELHLATSGDFFMAMDIHRRGAKCPRVECQPQAVVADLDGVGRALGTSARHPGLGRCVVPHDVTTLFETDRFREYGYA
jgi:hypothetical protein